MGRRRALELTTSCRPIGTRAAREMGFLDDTFGEDTGAFEAELRERARRLAREPEFRVRLRKKHERRLDDGSVKPLASYRAKELERMQVNFFGPDVAYHEARRRFSSRGIRRHRGAERQIRATAETPPGFSQRRAGPALVLRAFRDRVTGQRIDPDPLGKGRSAVEVGGGSAARLWKIPE